MNRLKLLVVSLSLMPVAALAQSTTTTPSPAAPTPSLPTNLTITVIANGTTTPYQVSIDGASLWDFSWQISQYMQNAQGTQWQRQYAIPMCLVPLPVVQPAAPAIGSYLDWNTSRLIYSGSFVNVSPATGAVYRDGVRLGTTAAVQKLCVYGNSLLGKGKGGNTWSRWDDKTSAWVAITGGVDPTVLN